MRSERRTLRCAIYTRKSSEHGLEQDFNSLHAQRESTEAYIKSQARALPGSKPRMCYPAEGYSKRAAGWSSAPLFDHLVGERKQRRRHCETKYVCGLQIDG